MKEPYIEGVATHGGPESCVGVRESAGEALTGVRAGWAIEPRNQRFGVPTMSHKSEGHIAGSGSASCWRAPRGQRTCACAETPCARTGRSHGRPSRMAGRAVGGRLRP
jgi:RNA-directed DNA polymerase